MTDTISRKTSEALSDMYSTYGTVPFAVCLAFFGITTATCIYMIIRILAAHRVGNVHPIRRIMIIQKLSFAMLLIMTGCISLIQTRTGLSAYADMSATLSQDIQSETIKDYAQSDAASGEDLFELQFTADCATGSGELAVMETVSDPYGVMLTAEDIERGSSKNGDAERHCSTITDSAIDEADDVKGGSIPTSSDDKDVITYITYQGLRPGANYSIVGKLMNKDDAICSGPSQIVKFVNILIAIFSGTAVLWAVTTICGAYRRRKSVLYCLIHTASFACLAYTLHNGTRTAVLMAAVESLFVIAMPYGSRRPHVSSVIRST